MEDSHNTAREIPYGKNILINCPNCGFKGEPVKYRKGNTLLEVVLWFLLLIPGAIYTARRRINTFCLCPKCKQHYLLETDGDNSLVDALRKIRKKQLCWFWIIVLVFSILGIMTFPGDIDGISKMANQPTQPNITTYTNYQQMNNTYVEPQKIEEENTVLSETKEEAKEEKVETSKDSNDEIREKMQKILKEIDSKYGNIDSYVGARCYGDCINGIVKIKFRGNLGWYDFTVKAHQADWGNKIIRENPDTFEKVQIDFIYGSQTVSSCTFTGYQMNNMAPKGCTYYGYKDTNDEAREKVKDILKQIDYKYGEDIRQRQDSYIGASCSGDCMDGIINIKFSENLGWYDFTVKAHSADWGNAIFRATPGVFEKIQINFICKGQTISSCTFTGYQMNSMAPKGCTYYGYKD